MNFRLFTLLTICAYVAALPGTTGLFDRDSDEAACERYCVKNGGTGSWSNKGDLNHNIGSCVCVPTKNSWCTATATITATKTITSTDRITATDTITKTKTITSTDSITATDTITKTKTITDTDSFTVTDTITKTKTITDTDTATVTDTITATVTGTGIICCNSQNWLGSGSQDACRQCHSPTGSGGGNGRRFNSAATEWDTQSPCA